MKKEYLNKKGILRKPKREDLNDNEYLNLFLENLNSQEEKIVDTQITILGEPINYVRERATRFSSKKKVRFYNAKEQQMKDMRKAISDKMNKEDTALLKSIIPNSIDIKGYTVSLELEFYKSIPKAFSIKDTILAENKIILPESRPDLDNYDKFVCDVLHTIAFDDDSRIVSIKSSKFYSIKPRTNIRIIARKIITKY